MLKIRNLTIKFAENVVVNNVNMDIEDASIVAIVGESGSGKTVTTQAIAGLLDTDADISGLIEYNGINLNELSKAKRRELNGTVFSMVFQEPMSSLDPLQKIGRQVEEVIKLHTRLNKRERKEKVFEALEAVELKNPQEIYDMYPHELSGGMRQRVMLAIAIAVNQKFIIADEPTTALDVYTQRQIIELLRKINREYKATILFVSHNLNVVHELCNKVYVMHNGEFVENGNTENVFNNPDDEYTKTLIASASTGIKKKRELSDENILEVDRLSVYYEKNKNIISDISFKVRKGEIVGLIGKSGCGKTTLAKTILGIHKGYEGSIMCREEHPQMIFQDPYGSLNPAKTIKWILEEPLKIKQKKSGKKINKEENDELIKNIMNKVGLDVNYLKRHTNELSGGQRQRVAIALSILTDSKLIVADEPVSALDLTMQAQILKLLIELQAQYGMAIIFISHDMSVVNKICDSIIELKACEDK